MDNVVAPRTPREISGSHGRALMAGDLDEIVVNYGEDAAFITPAGVKCGRDGAREVFTQLFAGLPHARWDLKIQTFAGDVLFLEWSASSDINQAEHGVDTFVFRDGLIHSQPVRYTLTTNN